MSPKSKRPSWLGIFKSSSVRFKSFFFKYFPKIPKSNNQLLPTKLMKIRKQSLLTSKDCLLHRSLLATFKSLSPSLSTFSFQLYEYEQ